VGRARRSILQDRVKDVRNIRSEVKLRTFVKFCVFPLHNGSWFEKYHSLRNYWNLYAQFLQYWVQEFHLYRQIVTKNPFGGFTFKACKMSGNWGDLIIGPSWGQCVKQLYLHFPQSSINTRSYMHSKSSHVITTNSLPIILRATIEDSSIHITEAWLSPTFS
jgi:hypothetical protein